MDWTADTRRRLRERLLASRVGGVVRAQSDRLRRRAAEVVLEQLTEIVERLSEMSGVEPRLPARRDAENADATPQPVTPPKPSFLDTAGETVSPPEPSPLARHVRRLVDKRVKQLLGLRHFGAAEDPIEAVHDLRVASRRMRAFTAVYAQPIGDDHARRVKKPLRRITRAIGVLREWDVHAQQLGARMKASNDDAERAALEHLLEGIDGRRGKERKRGARALERIDFTGLAEALRDNRDRVIEHTSTPDQCQHVAWGALSAALDAARAALPSFDGEDVEAIHEFRISMKKLRYTLEMLEPAVGDAYAELHRRAKRVQDLLGDHHDTVVLHEIVTGEAALLREHGRSVLVAGLERIDRSLEAERSALFERMREPGFVPDFDAWRTVIRAALGLPPRELEAHDAPRAPAPDGAGP